MIFWSLTTCPYCIWSSQLLRMLLKFQDRRIVWNRVRENVYLWSQFFPPLEFDFLQQLLQRTACLLQSRTTHCVDGRISRSQLPSVLSLTSQHTISWQWWWWCSLPSSDWDWHTISIVTTNLQLLAEPSSSPMFLSNKLDYVINYKYIKKVLTSGNYRDRLYLRA